MMSMFTRNETHIQKSFRIFKTTLNYSSCYELAWEVSKTIDLLYQIIMRSKSTPEFSSENQHEMGISITLKLT